MKKITIIIAVSCVLSFGLVGCGSNDHEVSGRTYKGTLETSHNGQTNVYSVEISEYQARQGEEVFRLVQMTPVFTNGIAASYTSITGHDWNSSGSWNRIFYCGYHIPDGTNSYVAGCNSVVREKSGNWMFESCPGDAEKAKPFTSGQILFAIQELDEAMAKIRNPAHLSSVSIWNEREHRCEVVKAEEVQSPFDGKITAPLEASRFSWGFLFINLYNVTILVHLVRLLYL